MRILHICLAGPYTENATYQENILPVEQVKLGHEVTVWTGCYSWENGQKKHVGVCDKKRDDGITLKRFEYRHVINSYLTDKIRSVPKIYDKLEETKPDFIMLHGMQTSIVPELCRYLKDNPGVKFVTDSHADFLNSATNWFSKNVLHRGYYKKYVLKAYSFAQKVYCISPEAMEYNKIIYGLDDTKMSLLPLGGVIISDEEYKSYREKKRAELLIDDDIINIVHSGKLYPEKRTKDLLEAFDRLKNPNVHLTIIGSADKEVLEALEKSKRNPRISWLGWKSGNELIQYLCAGDIYCLPGDQSVTVQSAMCCRCGILVHPYDNYRLMKLDEKCYIDSTDELAKRLSNLSENRDLIDSMKRECFDYAKNVLDYSVQAKRILDTQ